MTQTQSRMTISQALGWAKTLQQRHTELVGLRNSNSASRSTRYGNEERVETKPEYDAKKLDKRITLIAREIRLVNDEIKRVNATVEVSLPKDEEVLGELE